jgi:NSS family neurotransmitter:Na+ symporter
LSSHSDSSNRPIFSSRLATIVTMIGVSVGLGNVWRFPYMMGEYGGSAFLIVYLFFTFLFAVPAVTAEWGLGRTTRQGPIGAFTAMWGKRTGLIVGCMLLFTVLVAGSYYIFVIANIGYLTSFSVLAGFSVENMSMFNQYLGDYRLQYIICIVLLLLSYIVLVKGLKNGIETISKIFVPFFVLVMIFLIVFVMQLENSVENLNDFLTPKFSNLQPTHIFAALGQAFFSLGLGGTFLVVFGSYLRSQENLGKSSIYIAIGDVSAALMAGLFIVPTVISLGLAMDQGPGLLFSTLPELFQRLPFGQVVGSFFLFALLMVTFISSVAALEVLLAGINDALGNRFSRKRIIITICLIEAIIILPIAIDPGLIGILDLVFGSGMQLLGSMLAILAFSWGQSKSKALQGVFGSKHKKWHSVYYYWIKWIVPATLLAVLVGYIVSKI